MTLPSSRGAFLRFSLLLPAGFLLAILVSATEPKTQMEPFRVEAEFGVDGLRIQNSNSFLNAHLLDQHGVAQMQDIAGIAPNLYSSNSDSRGFGDILALRGSANSIFFGAPAVALYVDDVPGGSVSSYSSELLNIENFVVKAGPQGTDYGRNAPGGVIDIKTRAPGATHRGKLQLDYGSFDARGMQASFDGPLSDKAGYSASVGYVDREGYLDNTFLRRTADDRRSAAGRGSLILKPSTDVQVRLGALFEHVDDDAARLSSLFSPDRYSIASDVNGETQIDRLHLSAQLRKKFAWGALIATSARQEWDLDPALTDLDLSPLPLGFSRVAQNEELWTQELRLESTPSAHRGQWRAGLFLSDSDTDASAYREFVVPPGGFVPPGFVQMEDTDFAIGQTTIAGYANADRPIMPGTLLKAGLRLERVDTDIDRTKANSNNFRFPSPQDPRLLQSRDDSYLSATAGLVQTVSESLSLQIRSSLARKPAGYSGFTANPALAGFGDEKTWANEAGVTFGPPRGRIAGSVLGFWNRSEGYQFERTVPGSTDFVVVNAARVIARGLEAKFTWNPLERLWWDAQAGYTHATFRQHRDAAGGALDGNRVPYVPRFTLRTGVTIDLSRGFSANASYAGVGRTYFDERNTRMFSQGAYSLVNAQLQYRHKRMGIVLHAQNLLEEGYDQFINPEIFAGSPGAPRRIGVRMTLEY